MLAAAQLCCHAAVQPRELNQREFPLELSKKSYRLRGECLDVQQLLSVTDSPEPIEPWRYDCNQVGQLSALGHLTPREFVIHRQGQWTAEPALLQ